jgi:hypothetical protein
MSTLATKESSIMIDSKEASAALSDVNEMVARVRQSRIYELASQFMVVAGVFVAAGDLATFAVPRSGLYIWPIVNVMTILVSVVISRFDHRRTGVRSFDLRTFVAFLLFYGFGLLCSVVLGHYGPREWERSGRSISCCSTASPDCGSVARSSRSVFPSRC